jgi:type IV pilus assembly protein PilC
MVTGSEWLQSYWYVAVGLALTGFFALRALWRSPAYRSTMDRLLHRVPVIRDLLRGLAIARFSQVLGLSLRSGLSLLEGLSLAGRASGRPLLACDAEKMREQVNHGGRLADVLLTCSYFPPFTRRMLTAGEEAGELSKMCAVVTRHYDREVTHLTRNVTTVIEPVMIAGLAGVVALAIFLPMWNMAALVG